MNQMRAQCNERSQDLRFQLESLQQQDAEDPNYYVTRQTYVKAIQKATASNKTVSPGTFVMGTQKKNEKRPSIRKTEKEALHIETDLCQVMHFQMCVQNQSSLAKRNMLIIRSFLEREREELKTEKVLIQQCLDQCNSALESAMNPRRPKSKGTVQEMEVEFIHGVLEEIMGVLKTNPESLGEEVQREQIQTTADSLLEKIENFPSSDPVEDNGKEEKETDPADVSGALEAIRDEFSVLTKQLGWPNFSLKSTMDEAAKEARDNGVDTSQPADAGPEAESDAEVDE